MVADAAVNKLPRALLGGRRERRKEPRRLRCNEMAGYPTTPTFLSSCTEAWQITRIGRSGVGTVSSPQRPRYGYLLGGHPRAECSQRVQGMNTDLPKASKLGGEENPTRARLERSSARYDADMRRWHHRCERESQRLNHGLRSLMRTTKNRNSVGRAHYLLVLVALLLSGCMCWPPIPNASAHSRRTRLKKPPPPIELSDYARPVSCELDFVEGYVDCGAPFQVDASDGRARVAIDVPDNYEMRVDLEICDPREWVLNIGDSPTNDGGGGDYGSTSNDAELQIFGTRLDVFGNDFALRSPDRWRTVPGLLQGPECDCERVTARVRDQEIIVRTERREYVFRGEVLLRLAPPRDREGAPDSRWFVALNRVIDGAHRQGNGVARATITVAPSARLEAYGFITNG